MILNGDMWAVIIISSNRLEICTPKKLMRFFFSLSLVLLLTVPGSEVIKQDVDEDGQKQNWDCKKVKHLHTNTVNVLSAVSVSVIL